MGSLPGRTCRIPTKRHHWLSLQIGRRGIGCGDVECMMAPLCDSANFSPAVVATGDVGITKENVSNWTSVTVCAWMSPCVITMGGN